MAFRELPDRVVVLLVAEAYIRTQANAPEASRRSVRSGKCGGSSGRSLGRFAASVGLKTPSRRGVVY
jgi:hypothetical protein